MKLIKILAAIGTYQPGEVVEVSDETAAALCREVEVNDGHGVSKVQRAVFWDPSKKIQSYMKAEDMTAKDMAELGVKNVVATPEGPITTIPEVSAESEGEETKKKKGSKKKSETEE